MEFINTQPSPPMGSWFAEEFEQDFCYGAKASTSQNPVFSTPPGSCASGDLNEALEWSEQTSNFNDFGNLESFSDAALLENICFSPEDLFGAVEEESPLEIDEHKFYAPSSQISYVSPIFKSVQSSPDSPLSQKLPTVKIKLKRVKRPKSSKQKLRKTDLGYEFTKQKLIPDSISTDYHLPLVETQQSQKILQEDLPYFIEPFEVFDNEAFSFNEKFSLESFATAAPVSPPEEISVLSLRDAIDLGEVDDFLKDLLKPNTDDGSESSEIHMEFEEGELTENEDVHSPLSSVNSFVPSPSFEYTDHSYSPLAPDSIDHLSPSQSNVEENFIDFPADRKAAKKLGGGNSKHKKVVQKLSEESRYLRKKEQNKQAALRYRMKRRQEDHSLADTLKLEEERQEKINKEFSSLKQEIAIMKNLLREAFIAKQMVPKGYFSKNSS